MLELLRKTIHKAKSKEGRVLIENFASLGLVQFANYTLPLISLPYLVRVIGVEKFGIISMASVVILYFQTFVDFGFHYTAAKEVAQNQGNKTKVSLILSRTIFAQIFILFVCAIILTVLSFTITYLQTNRLIIWLTFLMLPGHIFFPTWFFQGMEKMKYIAILNVINKLIFTVLIFIIIKNESDFFFYPALISLGYFISAFLSVIIILKKFNVRLVIPSFKDLITAYKSSYNVFLNLLFPNLYNNMSTLLLGFFHGDFIVGIYSAAKRFIQISEKVLDLFSKTAYPFLARKIQMHHVYSRILIIISVAISILLIIFADNVVMILFGEEFSETINLLRILATSIVFIQMYKTYGINYLVLVDKAIVLRNISFWGSLFGLIATLILTYYFSAIGSCIAILVTRAVLGSGMYFSAKKHINSQKKI